MHANEATVRDLHHLVWSCGDYAAIERLVASDYLIHSDPGDAWEGKILDRDTYQQRVQYSRNAFPDLVFSIHEVVVGADRVAARWSAVGTHRGDLNGLPATGRRLEFSGQTIYEMASCRVAGHWQVVDRLSFIQQLR